MSGLNRLSTLPLVQRAVLEHLRGATDAAQTAHLDPDGPSECLSRIFFATAEAQCLVDEAMALESGTSKCDLDRFHAHLLNASCDQKDHWPSPSLTCPIQHNAEAHQRAVSAEEDLAQQIEENSRLRDEAKLAGAKARAQALSALLPYLSHKPYQCRSTTREHVESPHCTCGLREAIQTLNTPKSLDQSRVFPSPLPGKTISKMKAHLEGTQVPTL